MENKIFGLSISVYKSPLGDSTANGLSSKHNSLILIGDTVSGPFSVDNILYDDSEDYLVLVQRPRFNDAIAVPKSVLDEGVRYMFGGNFAYTSDSRFPEKAPIKIFDRVER